MLLLRYFIDAAALDHRRRGFFCLSFDDDAGLAGKRVGGFLLVSVNQPSAKRVFRNGAPCRVTDSSVAAASRWRVALPATKNDSRLEMRELRSNWPVMLSPDWLLPTSPPHAGRQAAIEVVYSEVHSR